MDVYYAYAAYFALRNVGHQWFCLVVAILSFIPPVPLPALQKDHSVNRIHSDPFSHVQLVWRYKTNRRELTWFLLWRSWGQTQSEGTSSPEDLGARWLCLCCEVDELLCWLEVAVSPGSRTVHWPFQRAAACSVILKQAIHVCKSSDIQLWGAFLSSLWPSIN